MKTPKFENSKPFPFTGHISLRKKLNDLTLEIHKTAADISNKFKYIIGNELSTVMLSSQKTLTLAYLAKDTESKIAHIDSLIANIETINAILENSTTLSPNISKDNLRTIIINSVAVMQELFLWKNSILTRTGQNSDSLLT